MTHGKIRKHEMKYIKLFPKFKCCSISAAVAVGNGLLVKGGT